MRLVLALLAVAAVVALAVPYGFVRALVGVALFAGILTFGYKYWRDVGLIPPEPEVQDLSDQELRYVCRVCGLELKVEKASRDKAPTHCGEKMELVRAGPPPLKPID